MNPELLAKIAEIRRALDDLEALAASGNNKATPPDWPEAVPDSMRVGHDLRLAEARADQIVQELVDPGAQNVLDFGCGDGSVARAIKRLYPDSNVVGYDPIAQEGQEDVCITSSLGWISMLGQTYDLVLLYDVLDHSADPVECLATASRLLAPGGRMVVRTHPWTSPHGAHQYDVVNRAYIHLYCSDRELADLGFEPPPNIRVTRPIATYDQYFKQAGLTVVDRKVRSRIVPDFFRGEIMSRIIRNTWGDIDEPTAKKIMAVEHIDYTAISS